MYVDFHVRANPEMTEILADREKKLWFDLNVERTPSGFIISARDYTDRVPEAIKMHGLQIREVIIRCDHSTACPDQGVYVSGSATGHVEKYFVRGKKEVRQAKIRVRSRYLSSAIRLLNEIMSQTIKPKIAWIEPSADEQEDEDYPDAEDFGDDSE